MIGDKRFWGKGLAAESMALLLHYGFNELGLDQFTPGVVGENIGAIRAYEKLGFWEVKRQARSVKYGETWHDQVTMMLTRERCSEFPYFL